MGHGRRGSQTDRKIPTIWTKEDSIESESVPMSLLVFLSRSLSVEMSSFATLPWVLLLYILMIFEKGFLMAQLSEMGNHGYFSISLGRLLRQSHVDIWVVGNSEHVRSLVFAVFQQFADKVLEQSGKH